MRIIALPFEKPTYQKESPNLEEPSAVYFAGSSGLQEVGDDDDDEPVLRVSTRASFSYELDRFEKNAMLVINNSTADAENTMYILHAFQNHRFELSAIETEEDTRDGIWQKVDQFFRRDFSNYGTVAVITVNCPDLNAPERDNCVGEWDVLNYFLLNQPPTLNEKPKIFITEAGEPSSPPSALNLPSEIIIVQTKHIANEKYRTTRPLDILCYKFISMEGRRDIMEILQEVNYETAASFPNSPIRPVSCLTMLTKELVFQRDSQPDSSVGDWMSKLADPVMFQICWRLLMKSKAERGETVELEPSAVQDAVEDWMSKLADPVMFQICWRFLLKSKAERGETIELEPSAVQDMIIKYEHTKE